MHSTTQTGFIWIWSEQTDHGYGWSSLGNLDKIRFGMTLITVPLQERFHSNNKRTLPIAVHNITARLASIKSIVALIVSSVHRTTVRTPFRRVISINNTERSGEHFAMGDKERSEFGIRNAINCSSRRTVKLLFSVLRLLPFGSYVKFFNRNRGIIFPGKNNNLFCNLSASCFNKVVLVMFKSVKQFSGFIFIPSRLGKALKVGFPGKVLPLSVSNITTEIKLFFNFKSQRIINRNCCEGGRTNIYSDNVPVIIHRFRKTLFKHDRNAVVTQERDIIERPARTEERGQSIPLPVKFNRDGNRFLRRICNFKTRISSFGIDKPEPPFIKPDGTGFESVFNCFAFCPDVFSGFLNNIGWQIGGITNGRIC